MALLLNANDSVNRSYTITKPSPNHPLDVNGVGVRTENLFNKNRRTGITNDSYISQNGQIASSSNYYISYPIPVNVGETYTWSFNDVTLTTHTLPTVGFYDNNDNLISVATHSSRIYHFTFTVPSNTSYIKASVYKVGYATSMLLSGNSSIDDETPMPYIPYGYKIPISSGGVTTNIYLGSTQTTRKIKKLVLDGTEDNWRITGTGRMAMPLSDMPRRLTTPYCTHFIGTTVESYGNMGDGECSISVVSGSVREFGCYVSTITTLADFKTWLQQQYAACTPVTIWYVLATPETAAVNEPLMKIGDYADTLSDATSILTTDGANSITVDTTVQPSEFTATWTGWHDATTKEWDGSHWNE